MRGVGTRYEPVKMLRAKNGLPKATGMKSSRCQASKGNESLWTAVSTADESECKL
jgi:hypothetical protein